MPLSTLPHDKTNKMAFAPSEDSDQPGHPPSLISVFAVRMKQAWVLSYPLSSQRRLIRLGRCSGWSESLLGAVILLVLSWGSSNEPTHEKRDLEAMWFWDPSNVHVQPLKGVRVMALCLMLLLVPYFASEQWRLWRDCAMCRLTWAFAVCLCDKYLFHIYHLQENASLTFWAVGKR